MLASTIQFSNNKQTPTNTQGHPRVSPGVISCDTHHTLMAEAPEPNNVPPPPPTTNPHPFHTHTNNASSTRHEEQAPGRDSVNAFHNQSPHPAHHTRM